MFQHRVYWFIGCQERPTLEIGCHSVLTAYVVSGDIVAVGFPVPCPCTALGGVARCSLAVLVASRIRTHADFEEVLLEIII